MPLSNEIYALIGAGSSKTANTKLGIPRRYRFHSLKTFEGFKTEVSAARKALARNEGVYLFGACGTGKTHLAVALLFDWYANKVRAALEVDRKPPDARFISTIDLLLELKENFSTKTGEPELLRKYSALELLVLDDLGAERSSEWSRQVVNTLVDRRYRDVSPTIFTSNLDLGAIAAAFDDRMASRIAGTCAVIKLDGPDRRVTRAPEQQSLAVGT